MDNELIILSNGNIVPISTDALPPNNYPSTDGESPLDPLINAALFFDSNWQNAQAAELRINLLTLIFGGAENIPAEYLSIAQNQNEPTSNLLNQSLDSLIASAQNHQDFENFLAQPKEFWNEVRQMSEVRIVEKYINGKLEPRVVSRYGELLEKFNHQDGQTEKFLNSVTANEQKVFQARFQINQTFGANELFIGNNIALDKHGQFPVRVFLSGNGKNPDFSPHSILSLLGGDWSARELSLLKNALPFADGQILYEAKSPALLGLSLALYQNVNSRLSLEDVALDSFAPKNFGGASEQSGIRSITQSFTENGKINGRAAEAILVAAFINAAWATIYQFGKFDRRSSGGLKNNQSANFKFGFSAGATGAIIGASIGCIAPLAEKNVSEVIGFAASVVVGLTDSGLRTLGANTVVAVITSGVQIFLNAENYNPKSLNSDSPRNFPNAKKSKSVFENDLRQRLFNSRMKILSAT